MNQKVLVLSILAPAILSMGATNKTIEVKTMPIKEINGEQYSTFIDKTITVAVIDTGLNTELFNNKVKLCNYGHKDFTGTGLNDNHGHGTHISGLIEQYAGDSKYCQIIIKYFDPKAVTSNNLINTIKAFKLAIELNVDVINYSGGGTEPSVLEKKVVEEALNRGIKVVVAAGNERCNMDSGCKYFPAMYDSRIIVIGNVSPDRVPAESSNSGTIVSDWEVGVKVESYCTNGILGCSMTGTSQSTAIHSGKVINVIDKNRKVFDIDKLTIIAHTA